LLRFEELRDVMRIVTQLFFYLVLLPISYMPFPVLYILSDGLYLIIYKVIGYRKKVVLQNVANSFPEKSREEHLRIVNEFYKHLCDLVVESIKVFTISEKQVKQRFKFVNPEFIDRFYDQGRSVIIAGGHKNNWELLAVAIDAEIKHKSVALYKRLNNKFFDEKMRATRGKYGLKMIPTRMAKEEFENNDGLRAFIFGFDQSPSNPSRAYWTTFLNQDTAMNFGVEKYAKDFNYPVLYGRINKLKRGHYNFEFTEAIENPQQTEYGYITRRINLLLEQDIIAEPQYWLWSHKRWKHKRPADLVQP
jgi:Kdo2-lipid IVA lauroyltransferase/acyltransferase